MALTIQQRKERRLGVGGSDIAALFGISNYNTPLDIYIEKTSTEEPEEEEPNPFVDWGNRHEPNIIKKFEEVMNVQCETGMDTYIHPDYPYMRANIDAKVDSNTILECKTASYLVGRKWSPLGGDNIPEPYLLQCAYYAEILNVNRVYIAVLIGGNDFRIYHYDRNLRLGDLIIKKVKDFWENHVLKQIPPEPITMEDATRLWEITQSDNIKVAEEPINEAIHEFNKLKLQRDELDSKIEKKKLEICSFMQDSVQLNDMNGNVLATWKMQDTNRFDAQKFKKDYPELFEKYTKQTQSRTFRIKESK